MRRRLKVFAVMLIVLLSTVTLGAVTPLEGSEAARIIEDVKTVIPQEPNVQAIFINNLRIALLMMIPVFGLIAGTYAIYNTGLVFAATGVTTDVSGGFLLFVTVLLPFFWLEFITYAAAMTENIYLTINLIRRRIRREFRQFIFVIALLIALLLAGAFVEVWVINLLT